MQPSKRASLLGLPPELRINIYEHLFNDFLHSDVWIVFHLYNNLYNQMPKGASAETSGSCGSKVSVLRTCRPIYQEAIEVLYSRVEVKVCIMGLKKPTHLPRRFSISRPEEMDCWRYVKDLHFAIVLDSGRENGQAVLDRVLRFAEAVRYGVHLRKIRIAFITLDDEGLPSYFDDVAHAMEGFRVDGQVDVMINPDNGDDDVEDFGDNAVCKRLVEMIRSGGSVSTPEK